MNCLACSATAAASWEMVKRIPSPANVEPKPETKSVSQDTVLNKSDQPYPSNSTYAPDGSMIPATPQVGTELNTSA